MSWSRAFERPDSLSDNDIRALNDVRREIWVSGAKGMVGGAFTGLGSLLAYNAYNGSKAQKQSKLLPKQSRNPAFLAFMLGGVIGGYVSVRLTGFRSIRDLYPVFDKAHPKEDKSLDKLVSDELAEGHRERVLQRRRTLNDALSEDARSH